eukprot:TRINITY_DN15105_c0_g1_i1.p1 TRINITY_DN15105_c0_g1~~TRINITY_DN15105_c0_g1_i1.p1  ORF type:complete len:138 (+),score=9.16 TRINITY_DN15105_c0_g1_i1:128-541(+)
MGAVSRLTKGQLWFGVGAVIAGGYAAKIYIWQIMHEQITDQRDKGNADAQQYLARRRALAIKYALPPLTPEQQAIAQELRQRDRQQAAAAAAAKRQSASSQQESLEPVIVRVEGGGAQHHSKSRSAQTTSVQQNPSA